MNTTDLWASLGALEPDQALHVLTELFARYEHIKELKADSPEAASFFRALAAILAQVQSCNVSRR